MATTMYDVIMDLPLFQGISRQQVSAFLEKTHVEFLRADIGDLILMANTISDTLMFVISGQVEICWQNTNKDLTLTFRQGSRSLIGATRLFGMDRNIPFSVTAIQPTSMLRIDKAQYLNLLQTQPVYLLNYLNYLSLRAQKPVDILKSQIDGSLLEWLRNIVQLLTPSSASEITFTIKNKTLGRMVNMEITSVRRRLLALQREGLIEIHEDSFTIPSRRALLNPDF